MTSDENKEATLLQRSGGNIHLANSARRVNPRPEGIAMTSAEFKTAKAKKIEEYIRREEERQNAVERTSKKTCS